MNGRLFAAALVAASGTAQGATISFASDTLDQAWTFRGASIFNQGGGPNAI